MPTESEPLFWWPNSTSKSPLVVWEALVFPCQCESEVICFHLSEASQSHQHAAGGCWQLVDNSVKAATRVNKIATSSRSQSSGWSWQREKRLRPLLTKGQVSSLYWLNPRIWQWPILTVPNVTMSKLCLLFALATCTCYQCKESPDVKEVSDNMKL